MLGVTNDNRLARRSRGRVHLDDFVERLGEKPIGKRLTQRVLISEGKLANIFKRLDVLGLHAHLVHLVAIPRHVLIGVGDLRNQLLELDRTNALTARSFHGAVEHGEHVEMPCSSSLESGAFHRGVKYLFSGTVHYHHNFLEAVTQRDAQDHPGPEAQRARFRASSRRQRRHSPRGRCTC